MSAGLQNALTTIYSGAVVRTGNVTGIVTDLSLELGTWLFLRSCFCDSGEGFEGD